MWFDGSAFSFWFDGSDVDLTNKTQEKIDALHVLSLIHISEPTRPY